MRATMTAAALVLMLWAPAARAAPPIDLIAPVDGPISRHFEPPPTPFAAGHRGLDFDALAGSPVLASAGGIVAFAGQVGGRLFVSIDHPEGLRTTYSFLDTIAVRAGQQVAQGEPIATSGTGHAGSTQDHLHFGLREGDTYLDPEPVLLASMRRNLWRVVHLIPVP